MVLYRRYDEGVNLANIGGLRNLPAVPEDMKTLSVTLRHPYSVLLQPPKLLRTDPNAAAPPTRQQFTS